MKTQAPRIAVILIGIILLWMGPAYSSEFPFSPVQLSSENHATLNQEKADSLEIVKIDAKYYVFCSVCPIKASNGFLQKEIVDTIQIDSLIPEKYWVKAYVAKWLVYDYRPNRSHLLMEEGRLVIKNSRDEYHAMLMGNDLISLKLIDVQKNSARNAINSGRAATLCLIGFGLLLGLIIYKVKRKMTKILSFLLVACSVFLFLRLMFQPTDEALYLTMGAFITGVIFMFIVMLIVNSVSKKKKAIKK